MKQTQTQKVLEAFLAAPYMTMTTAEIDKIPYITCQRQEISRLRKLGHIILCERIKGKNQSKFTYGGKMPIICGLSEEAGDLPSIGGWRNLSNGMMVLTQEGIL